MRKLWRRYPSTVLSVLFLVLAGFYGWYDARSQKPVLGLSDTSGYEKSVVLDVIDGQTVYLDDGRTVKLAGIQVPTVDPTTGQLECYAAEALALTRSLLQDKVVFLEKGSSDQDRYGRSLRYVWVGDRLINHELLLQGAAVYYSPDSDSLYKDDLQASERAARVQAKGLWRQCREGQ